jgi:hypothetical protein
MIVMQRSCITLDSRFGPVTPQWAPANLKGMSPPPDKVYAKVAPAPACLITPKVMLKSDS